MIGDTRPDGAARRYFGLFPAIVTNIVDTEKLGRIQVKFPFLGKDGEAVRAWATLVSPYAGDDQGFEVLPAVDTQVIVGFEAGVLERPYLIGACWNGKESLPKEPAEANNYRLIKTRSGSQLEFDDTEGSLKITLSLKSGMKLVLDDGSTEVQLKNSNGCLLKFDSSGNVTLTALAGVTINAPSGLTVNAPSATFSGSVSCKPLTATAISSPLYSQGAGNIW